MNTPSPDPDRSPIFVVGTGRSGTTLLRLMLNAHPRIYLTHEASLFMIRSGLSPRPTGREWLERYFQSASYRFLRMSRQELSDEVKQDPERDNRISGHRAVMRTMARRHGKARYGDKTPLHTDYMEEIFRDFPEARVVHIVRDPRATVASLLRMPWAPSSVGLNSLFCWRSVRRVAEFRERVFELRLEDLLADPKGTLGGVLDFVGEAWDDAVLEHARHAPLDDVPPFPWFDNAKREPRPPSGTPAWIEELSPAWIRNIEQVNRATMERFAYSRADLSPEPGLGQRQLARVAEAGEVVHSLQHLVRFQLLTRRLPPPDPREVVATLMQWNPRAWKRYPGFVLPGLPALR